MCARDGGWIQAEDGGRGQREEKISESVIRARYRGKEMSEKSVDGGQRERKSVQGHLF